MIFRDWLKGLEYTLLQGNVDVETEDVIYDSRKAAPGKVFVAMKGIRADGHSFIPQVLKAGVTVLVTERPVEEELKASGLSGEELNKITVVMVEEGRHALALLSAARFGHPTKKPVSYTHLDVYKRQGSNGKVNHVAIYIGNGRIVHAASRRSGIKTSTWNYRTPVAIRSMLD